MGDVTRLLRCLGEYLRPEETKQALRDGAAGGHLQP